MADVGVVVANDAQVAGDGELGSLGVFHCANGQHILGGLNGVECKTAFPHRQQLIPHIGHIALFIGEEANQLFMNGEALGLSAAAQTMGYEDTLSVTMEDMIHHTAAVCRGAKNALVVGDMPFMSYQTSVYDAVVNAGRLMKEGRANAVKLEGGKEVCEQIKAITNAGIPVMAHLGLTPQSINAFGGFKVQGKSAEDAQKLLDDAKAVEKAGAFALVLECVPAKLAELISKTLKIPTIGIGWL